MSDIRKQIKERVEYVLENEQDETVLNMLNEKLAEYQQKLQHSAWERTPDSEKDQIRKAFADLEVEDNQTSHSDMKKYFQSWREKLSGEA